MTEEPQRVALPAYDPSNIMIWQYLDRPVAVSVTPAQVPGQPVWLLALTFRDVTTTYTHWMNEPMARDRINELEAGIIDLRSKQSGGLIVPPPGTVIPPHPGINGHRRI